MKKLEEVRAELLKAMTTANAEDEREDLSKSADQALADAIQGYLSVSNEPATPKVGKTIKEKGIALCHSVQGYSANLRPVSLMMKSKLEDLTTEQLEALKRLGYAINQVAE
ncbi:hypothetical protein RHD99_07785 [Buttiauxella selenatireducens]|uniref:Uncharacterized protein n=1 Tax=Buttiauxella selenatireducens TaxID=3073902 RepID=A0ABY9SF53_9ENTR|nr:hypothetical protein [Buttiauxella sp. R73]WMY75830.1 hypothetical protein RHD99_07785 [Buttiauxella sp. R73]